MELQHLDLKLPLEAPEALDLGMFIPVFHRWVRDQVGDGLLIDVADYRHVPAGPGIVLVGHDANYSLDMAGNRPGLRVIRKTAVSGGADAALGQGLQALDHARTLLEGDSAFSGRLRFSDRVLELKINDRLLAPNHPDTFAALHPVLQRFFASRGSAVRIDFHGSAQNDPRQTFGVTIRTETSLFPTVRAA